MTMLERLNKLADQYNLYIRTVAATLVLAGGIVHLRLNTDFPNDNVERMWAVNFAASVAVAVALVVWRHWLPVLAAYGVTIGTLLAFGISRTDTGVPFTSVEGLGRFQEQGWNPSPDAALSVVVEVVAAVLLVLLLPSALAKASRR